MKQDGVGTAFDIILEEIETVTQDLNREGAVAFSDGNYKQAGRLSETGIQLQAFCGKVAKLRDEWLTQFDLETRSRTNAERIEQPKLIEEEGPETPKPKVDISGHSKSPVTRLRVTFQDSGIVIEKHLALETLLATVRAIGVEKVRQLGLSSRKIPLIATEKHPTYRQHRLGKYFVITNTSTQEKKKIIEAIADALKLKLEVEVI